MLAMVLLFAALAAACEAPARAPGTPSAVARWVPNTPGDPYPIPDGFPLEGIAPEDAFYRKQSDVWVVGTATVQRILRDDTKRPRHQRFVVRVSHGGGPTFLIAHNIDLAPRVPLKKGDLVAFRGEYVWNAQGGIVHWTHRDRRDRQAGGWIVWKGQNFR